jgi:hypothetical protein
MKKSFATSEEFSLKLLTPQDLIWYQCMHAFSECISVQERLSNYSCTTNCQNIECYEQTGYVIMCWVWDAEERRGGAPRGVPTTSLYQMRIGRTFLASSERYHCVILDVADREWRDGLACVISWYNFFTVLAELALWILRMKREFLCGYKLLNCS